MATDDNIRRFPCETAEDRDRLDVINDLNRLIKQMTGLLGVLSDHAAAHGETDTHHAVWLACDQMGRIEHAVEALK